MELFIRLKNNQPFEHPIFKNNFVEAFPDVDLTNLPEWVMPFERIEYPTLNPYEVYEGVTYKIENGVCKDVHLVRQMTQAEKTAKQDEAKSLWVSGLNYASWPFDEATCTFRPPVSYPTDGKSYRWDEPSESWTEVLA